MIDPDELEFSLRFLVNHVEVISKQLYEVQKQIRDLQRRLDEIHDLLRTVRSVII